MSQLCFVLPVLTSKFHGTRKFKSHLDFISVKTFDLCARLVKLNGDFLPQQKPSKERSALTVDRDAATGKRAKSRGAANNGIPVFSEERLQERAVKKVCQSPKQQNLRAIFESALCAYRQKMRLLVGCLEINIVRWRTMLTLIATRRVYDRWLCVAD